MANLADLGAQVACAVCAVHPLCHSRAVAHGAPSPVECRRRVAAGESIHSAGAAGKEFFALRAGMAWMAIPDPQHGRHILRLMLPGDVGGLAALALGTHITETVAVEDSEVCVVPAYRLESMARHNERVATQLRTLLAAELGRAQEHAAALARLPGAARVARMLLDLSQRWAERGFSGERFRLPMGQREIGEHLNLTGETVNRVLSQFRSRGWIAQERREVRILEAESLREVITQPAAVPESGSPAAAPARRSPSPARTP